MASAGTLTLAGLHHAVKSRSSQIFAPSVWEGPVEGKRIALTFDDGPSPATAELLRYLDSQHVRATFFQCGKNVLRHPELARAVREHGHEIGNHTFSHRRLAPRLGWQTNFLSAQAIYEEFHLAQAVIAEHAGVSPALLRVPYGMRWLGLREAQRRLNLMGVMWTEIGRDWEWPAEAVARRILKSATLGAILCLHDGRDTRPYPDVSETLKAVEIIVPALHRMGYEMVTVSELMRPAVSLSQQRLGRDPLTRP